MDPAHSDRGFRSIDHTADLAIELWAPSEEELLIQGGRALAHLLAEGAKLCANEEWQMHVEAIDREDRLVRWLNELLYAALVQGFLFCDARIALTETGLAATVRGERDARGKVTTELKGVTYHDLYLGSSERGWTARVVIDV